MSRVTIGALTLALLLGFAPRLVYADYYATQLNLATFSSQVIRLNESTGQPVPGFAYSPQAGAELFLAASLTVGPDGFIYASDAGSGAVVRVNPVTGAATPFAMLPPIAVQPQFIPNAAAGLRFGPNGNLFVAGRGDDMVYELNGTNGNVVDSTPFAEGTLPTGLNFDSDGSLVVTGFQAGSVFRVVGNNVSELIPPVTIPATPLGVLPTGDGRYWVTDVFANTLRLYSDSGTPLIDAIAIPPMLPDELPPGATALTNSPSELSYDDDGNLLLATLGLVANQGFLYRIERPAGDFNGDLAVDQNDYDVWRENFGASPTTGQFDGNGDGVYDAADYTVWRDTLGAEGVFDVILQGEGSYSSILQFTPSVATLGGGDAVPEPAGLGLALMTLLAILVRKLSSLEA